MKRKANVQGGHVCKMRRTLGLSLIPRKEQCSKDEYIGEGAPVSETKNEQPE